MAPANSIKLQRAMDDDGNPQVSPFTGGVRFPNRLTIPFLSSWRLPPVQTHYGIKCYFFSSLQTTSTMTWIYWIGKYAAKFSVFAVLSFTMVDMFFLIPIEHFNCDVTIGRESGTLSLGTYGYCVGLSNNTSCTGGFLSQLLPTIPFHN